MNYSNVDVSIIIVNYNTYSLVLDCIKSIKNKTSGLLYEIIVVDNNSPNREIIQLLEIYNDVVLILHDRNDGFGSGNNVGAQKAKGNFLFFLNSDTLLINNSIKILHDYLINNSNVGVCGGNLFTKDLKPGTSYSLFRPSIFTDINSFFFNKLSGFLYKQSDFFNSTSLPLKIKGSISGADYMIRKDLFDELNGFDEDFFMYYEETELSYRVLKKKFEIYSVPEAKIIHFEGGSELVKERTLDWTFESKKIFYKKTSNLLSFYISNFLFFVTTLQRMFLFKLFNNKPKYIYWENIYKWEVKKIKQQIKL